MKNQDKIEKILVNYKELCNYCDNFYKSIKRLYSSQMKCKRKCFKCCELHTVCALEAYFMCNYLDKNNINLKKEDLGSTYCALLKNDECILYPVRPLICRSHGVPMYFDNKNSILSSCIYNFKSVDWSCFPKNHVFDTYSVTQCLLKLNIAFCIATGNKKLINKRFTLKSLILRKIPKFL